MQLLDNAINLEGCRESIQVFLCCVLTDFSVFRPLQCQWTVSASTLSSLGLFSLGYLHVELWAHTYTLQLHPISYRFLIVWMSFCMHHYALVNALNRRRFLYVVNLETPSEAPRKISRQSKWDVGTVQWNPHKTQAHLFAASVRKEDMISCWFMTVSYLCFHMFTEYIFVWRFIYLVTLNDELVNYITRSNNENTLSIWVSGYLVSVY